jgi:hypothetical protein
MAMGRIVQSRPGRACRGPSRQGARPGRRGRRGENPRHLVDPAEVGAADEKSLDALLPVLYLRGVSTGAFQEVLTALLGTNRRTDPRQFEAFHNLCVPRTPSVLIT